MQTLYQIQELIGKLPDNVLMQEANKPSGSMPIPMVIQELTRRKELRIAAQGQNADQPRQFAGMQDGGQPHDFATWEYEDLVRLARPNNPLPPGVREAVEKELKTREADVPRFENEARRANQGKLPDPSLYANNPPSLQPDYNAGSLGVSFGSAKGLGGVPPSSHGSTKLPTGAQKKRQNPAAGGRQAVSPSIKSPRPAAMTGDAYPEYGHPYQAVIDRLGQPLDMTNPVDATLAAQKERMAAEKPRWGEMGLAAAAALMGTRGGIGRGIGAAFGSVLPYAQQARAEKREDNRYLDQLGLQQALAAQQNLNRSQDRQDQLAQAQAQDKSGQQTYDLSKLTYGQGERELGMKENYYGAGAEESRAKARFYDSGGTQARGPTELQMANFIDGQMADLDKDAEWMMKPYAEKYNEARRRAGLYFGQNTGIATAIPSAADALQMP